MVSRPNFMTRAVIIIGIILFLTILFFVVPQFRAAVTSAAVTIRANLTAWAGGFTASGFYLTFIAPQLWLISMIIGGLIVGIIAIFAAKGYLGFIKLGRAKSQEIAGYQTTPIHQPVPIPVQPVQATPIVEPKQETT